MLTAATRSGAAGVALLQRVRDVEDDGQVVTGLLHDAKAQHVDHQVVIAEAGAAVAQDQLIVARFLEFFDDIGHLPRAEELRLLDVDDFACFCQGHDEVRLAREEGGQLQHVDHFGHLLRLPWLMHVGNHGHAERRLDVLEDAHAFFQARAAIGMDRRAVGLVEAGLEHIGNAQFLRHAHIFFAGAHGKIARFEHVDAAKQREAAGIADVDAMDFH
ncbi:hypothetical protein D3C72_1595320 [compost metagenome]